VQYRWLCREAILGNSPVMDVVESSGAQGTEVHAGELHANASARVDQGCLHHTI
jgi:hypothetical protein